MVAVVMHNLHDTDVIQLEAYKVRNQSRWASIGRPYFIKGDNGSVYSFTRESIKAHIRLLAHDQKEALQHLVKRKDPALASPAIILIPLQSFVCSTNFYQNQQQYTLTGEVHDLSRFTATLRIPCPKGTDKRLAFESRIQQADNLEWECQIMASGKDVRTNAIVIRAEQIQDSVLEGRLFGSGQEAYVTRHQLNNLVQTIRSKLTIEEDNEIDDDGLDESIMTKLIDLTTERFQQVNFVDALEKLSKFGATYNQRDLAPNQIKKQLSNVLTIRNDSGRQYVYAKSDDKTEGQTSTNLQGGASFEAGGKVFGLGGAVNGAVNGAKSNEKKWKKSNMSIGEQLHELNTANQQGLQWEVHGNLIVPKSLDIVKISKAVLNQNLRVTHKKRIFKDAKFKKTIVLQSSTFDPNATKFLMQKIMQRVRQLYQAFRGPPELQSLTMKFRCEHNRCINIVNFMFYDQVGSYGAILLHAAQSGHIEILKNTTLCASGDTHEFEIVHTIQPGTYKFIAENPNGQCKVSVHLDAAMVSMVKYGLRKGSSTGKDAAFIVNHEPAQSRMTIVLPDVYETQVTCEINGIRMPKAVAPEYSQHNASFDGTGLNLNRRNQLKCTSNNMQGNAWVELEILKFNSTQLWL